MTIIYLLRIAWIQLIEYHHDAHRHARPICVRHLLLLHESIETHKEVITDTYLIPLVASCSTKKSIIGNSGIELNCLIG